MAEYKVLITTSGIGSRLGRFTDYSNKCLTRLDNTATITKIIEHYEEDVDFVITLGHFGDQVEQYLKIAHPKRNFQFVNVLDYTGPKSSQVKSILAAENLLQCPFIYHACDTVCEEKINFDSGNWIGTHRLDGSTDQYRTVSVEKTDQFVSFNKKGDMGFSEVYIGIAAINNFKLYFDIANNLVNEDPENESISDCDVINLMRENFKIRNFKVWHDIGNVSSLQRARNSYKEDFEVLDKPKENIYFHEKSVIKFFYDKDLNAKRVKRSEILKGIVPEIIQSSENFFKYSFANGNVLSSVVTPSLMKDFLNWLDKNLWIKNKSNVNIKKMCHEFYFEKTLSRIETYKENFNNEKEYSKINNLEIPDIHQIVKSIDKDWLTKGIASRIHGDLILDNALYDGKKFTLIDWRQDFANCLEFGDLYYDLAKLNHNLVFNHELVNKKMYTIDYCNENENLVCDILCSKNLLDCKNVLRQFIIDNNLDNKKVEVLTALIWVNMSPLHEYPVNNFLFNFGKYNLYRTLSGK